MDVRVSLIGFVVGALIGLTGMGGGTVMTPLMIFLFHMHPAMAVGTDLVYASITKLAGALQHIRQKTVDFPAFKALTLGSVPGALLGSGAVGAMQHWLPMATVNLFISQLLGAVYLLTIAAVLWREYTRRHRPAPAAVTVPLPRLRLGLLGLVAGCIVGLTSVGSGSLYVALLALVYPVATAKLVGTDILQGVLVTGVAGLVHFAFGSVDLPMVASLLVGSVPGILLGSRMTVRIPDGAIRAGVLLMLGWSSYSLLLR